MSASRFSQWVLLGLLLILTVFWFGNLNDRALIQPDEGRYAEIAREMAQSGDWITPRLNDLKYFEKPPLQYWATAVAFRLFSESEWTARVPVSIAYPMLSIGYIVNALAAGYLFGEALTGRRWLGISFIMVGVYLLARSS